MTTPKAPAPKSPAPADNSELEWVKFRKEVLGDDEVPESHFHKLFSKMSGNLLVPLGALSTVAALVYGLNAFRKGDRTKSQYAMRARVAAQGFTIVAIIGGISLGSTSFVPPRVVPIEERAKQNNVT